MQVRLEDDQLNHTTEIDFFYLDTEFFQRDKAILAQVLNSCNELLEDTVFRVGDSSIDLVVNTVKCNEKFSNDTTALLEDWIQLTLCSVNHYSKLGVSEWF